MRKSIIAAALPLAAGLLLAAQSRERPTVREDITAGRAVFIASGCAECHAVSGDADLPSHAAHGPVLRQLSSLPVTEISARITARSPSGSKWMAAAESGMSNSTGCTTLQDVRHIAVYLQATAR